MIELEVKALVPDIPALKRRIEALYPHAPRQDSRQRNHYFSYTKPSLQTLISVPQFNLPLALKQELTHAGKLAVRTRTDSAKGTFLIFKYSLTDNNSTHSATRREFELPFPDSIESLDSLLLSAGLAYQSKWSRERSSYQINNSLSIMVDINAGYRGLCEVEILSDSEEGRANALQTCRKVLSDLKLTELDGVLLERMFAFYSAYYNDFYGTDKSIFDDPRFSDKILAKSSLLAKQD